jgi:murein DD-endopeptidase MepM/ murein hydrolase activator NlpD
MPTGDRTRQAVPRRPLSPAPRRWRPQISVHAALFVTLLAIAASLLIAAAQGPGTVGPPAIAGSTTKPRAVGDTAVRPAGSPRPAIVPADGTNSGTDTASLTKPPEKLTGYRWPMQRQAHITSFFDYRDSGFLSIEGRRIHEGLDMTTRCGDDVYAAHDGVVLAAGRRFDPFLGFSEPLDEFYARLERKGRWNDLPIAVVIDDGNGYRSVYVHLSDTTVNPGQKVRAGDRIGYEGSTGNASGCHLHYELIRMDGPWMAVAKERVREDKYPPFVRERIDPLRVLSLRDKNAAHLIPGVNPPKDPPRLKESAQP